MLSPPGFAAFSPPAWVPIPRRAALSSSGGWCRRPRQEQEQEQAPVPVPVPRIAHPRVASSQRPRQRRPREARGSIPGTAPPPHRGTAGAGPPDGDSVPLATALPGNPRGSARAASGPQRPLPQLRSPPEPLPPAAAACPRPGGNVWGGGAAGPGSGSLSGLPLPPAAGSGSQRGHYSARRAQRRHRQGHGPPSAGGDTPPLTGGLLAAPAVPVTPLKLCFHACVFSWSCTRICVKEMQLTFPQIGPARVIWTD